jgi:hypothetical protein
VEEWNGGMVRHIVRDQVILLERGQVFEIDGKTFFTFGGASSHDIQGGILEPDDPDFKEKKKNARREGKPYRVRSVSWWEQELPTEQELQEGLNNLEKYLYKVDYVISHCAANRVQWELERYYNSIGFGRPMLPQDVLTNYFEQLEKKLQYRRWFCGHYHEDFDIDEKHSILYQRIVPLSSYEE